jgi:molybdopterin converting factor small subunit
MRYSQRVDGPGAARAAPHGGKPLRTPERCPGVATTVRVLLFASAREAVGQSSLRRPIPDGGIALAEFLEGLAELHPPLRRVLRISRIVRNGEVLPGRSGRVAPGDEIAIYPPFSGG